MGSTLGQRRWHLDFLQWRSKDGSMVLTGKIYYASRKDNPISDFKGIWTPLANSVVKQHFEESTDGGKTWKPWFTGYYFKQNHLK